MPVLRFHLLDLYYAQVAGGFTVTCTTNAACHLYLRYSDNFPWIHRKPIERRGLVIGWDAMYCFTAYHHIEQNEAGDTFTHTFTWPGWKNCERRYFYFWGTMGGQDMVSDTPIFWLHYLEEEIPYGPPQTEYFYPSAIAIDGHIYRFTSPPGDNWHNITRGAGTHAFDIDNWASIRQWASTVEDSWYAVRRAPMLFDTTEIPLGSAIDEAKVRLRYMSKGTIGEWHGYNICVVQSFPASNDNLIPADFFPFGEIALSNIIWYDDWAFEFNTFTLNAAGRALVIPADITKLGLRNHGWDCLEVQPPWVDGRSAFISWYSSRNDLLSLRPRLEVTYRPPL